MDKAGHPREASIGIRPHALKSTGRDTKRGYRNVEPAGLRLGFKMLDAVLLQVLRDTAHRFVRAIQQYVDVLVRVSS